MKIDREMLKQALRNNVSCNQIAKSRGVSHNTVRRAKVLLERAGVSDGDIDAMTDTKLKSILHPGRQNTTHTLPNCENEVEYLDKGYTLQESHARYVEEVGEKAAIGYSTYCDMMKKYRHSQKTEFRHSHNPGEELQIDYGGKRPTGLENGRLRKFELFVAVFPASHYIYAICTRTQSTFDTIHASVKALEFYGGVPLQIVSDNLKAVVIKNNGRANSVINQQYLAFADYYNTRVAPTRVASPTDKASVEVAVQKVQDKLHAKLRGRPPLELAELNRLLRDVVDDLNSRPMKRGGETRLERFCRLDKSKLGPLPAERITYIELPVERRVPASYHISIDNVHYSVPSTLIGKKVSVRKCPNTIEIRNDGLPAAIHQRCYKRDKFITIETHRPENHLKFIEMKFNDWKGGLPAPLREIVEAELKLSRPAKERLMKRVNNLERTYGRDRLLTACDLALYNKSPNFKHVTNLLKNKLEVQMPEEQQFSVKFEPVKNVRGSDYFQRAIDGSGDVQ